MNNDLKNFLEGEKIHIYQAMDSFLTEYDTFEGQPARRSLERLNQDRHLFVEQMQLRDTRLINFVLEIVESVVEKMVVNTPNEVALLNKDLPSTLQTNYYNQAVGYVDAIEDVLTKINNLKVK